MSSSIPERTVESWLAVELEVWFPSVRLWAPIQNAAGNWDLATQGSTGRRAKTIWCSWVRQGPGAGHPRPKPRPAPTGDGERRIPGVCAAGVVRHERPPES
jgi:hypothetical protein